MEIEKVKQLEELYLAVGVGGMSFIVLILVLWSIMKNITPVLQKIQQDGAVTQSILINNTRAIEEMSKSNQNVAMALTILDKSMSSVHSDIKTVEATGQNVENMLIALKEHIIRR